MGEVTEEYEKIIGEYRTILMKYLLLDRMRVCSTEAIESFGRYSPERKDSFRGKHDGLMSDYFVIAAAFAEFRGESSARENYLKVAKELDEMSKGEDGTGRNK